MWISVALVLLLSGCGFPFIGGGTPSITQTFSIDAVKQIHPGIVAGDTPATYGQAHYEIGEARVLLRYESFSTHTQSVDLGTDSSKKVWVEVTVETAPTDARAHLKLCPLTADWMMLATWRHAHPFGVGGRWTREGADFDETSCQTADPVPASPGPSFVPERLKFDMTQWFVDFARGRSLNYGWVLTSAEPVKIVGETSPSRSPRMIFDKYVGL